MLPTREPSQRARRRPRCRQRRSWRRSADQLRLTAQGKLEAGDSFTAERAAAGVDDERAAVISGRVPCPRRADEGHRHRLAGARRRRRAGPQRPLGRRLRRRPPRRPRRSTQDAGDLAGRRWLPRSVSSRVYRDRLGRALDLGCEPATSVTSRHRASTATTASGSSCTSTSSASLDDAARTRPPPAGPDPSEPIRVPASERP